MKTTRHKNGIKSIRLNRTEQAWLWSLVREGRKVMCKNEDNAVHDFALNMMRAVWPELGDYVNQHMKLFDAEDENFAHHILEQQLKETKA